MWLVDCNSCVVGGSTFLEFLGKLPAKVPSSMAKRFSSPLNTVGAEALDGSGFTANITVESMWLLSDQAVWERKV